jgi:hypothetical protein
VTTSPLFDPSMNTCRTTPLGSAAAPLDSADR